MNRRPCFNMFSHLTSQGLFRMRIPPNSQTQKLSLQSFAVYGGLIPQISTLSCALISRNPTMTQTGAHPPSPKASPEGSKSSCSSPSAELSPGMTEGMAALMKSKSPMEVSVQSRSHGQGSSTSVGLLRPALLLQVAEVSPSL